MVSVDAMLACEARSLRGVANVGRELSLCKANTGGAVGRNSQRSAKRLICPGRRWTGASHEETTKSWGIGSDEKAQVVQQGWVAFSAPPFGEVRVEVARGPSRSPTVGQLDKGHRVRVNWYQ